MWTSFMILCIQNWLHPIFDLIRKSKKEKDLNTSTILQCKIEIIMPFRSTNLETFSLNTPSGVRRKLQNAFQDMTCLINIKPPFKLKTTAYCVIRKKPVWIIFKMPGKVPKMAGLLPGGKGMVSAISTLGCSLEIDSPIPLTRQNKFKFQNGAHFWSFEQSAITSLPKNGLFPDISTIFLRFLTPKWM